MKSFVQMRSADEAVFGVACGNSECDEPLKEMKSQMDPFKDLRRKDEEMGQYQRKNTE